MQRLWVPALRPRDSLTSAWAACPLAHHLLPAPPTPPPRFGGLSFDEVSIDELEVM